MAFWLRWHRKQRGKPMERFLLFVGGHEGRGAPIDWQHFAGSFVSEHDLREKVMADSYYTILDGQSGKVLERGHCDADGGCHPWPEEQL